jgi:hypothetical protein
MSATYDPNLISEIDNVRFRLGDIDVSNARVPNETIEALLSASGASVLSVASKLARSLAAQYAAKVDTDLDNQGFKWSQLAKQFTALASELAAEDAAERLDVKEEGDLSQRLAMGGGIMVSGADVSSQYEALADPEFAGNFHKWETVGP